MISDIEVVPGRSLYEEQVHAIAIMAATQRIFKMTVERPLQHREFRDIAEEIVGAYLEERGRFA